MSQILVWFDSYLNRQQKRKKAAHNNVSEATNLRTRRGNTASAHDNNTDENDFARAFGHVQMSAALRREVEEFSAQAQRRAEARRQETVKREQPKVGRNEPCPCGSGKKFKQCHGKK